MGSDTSMRPACGRLAGFLLRSRRVVPGRGRVASVRRRLLFVLVTEDASERTVEEIASGFRCPVVQAYTSADLDDWFGFRNTKVLGFLCCDLSRAVFRELKGRRLDTAEDTRAGQHGRRKGGKSPDA